WRTCGRVPTVEPSTPAEPTVTTQLTPVQGLLARSIPDLRLGLIAMAARDARDPWWVPAPLGDAPSGGPARVALCNPPVSAKADAAVIAALKVAARNLEAAGWAIEEVMPPDLEEEAQLFFFSWTPLKERPDTKTQFGNLGSNLLRRARAWTMACAIKMDFGGYFRAFARRATILREWQLFFERYPLLLMPISFQRPLPNDF